MDVELWKLLQASSSIGGNLLRLGTNVTVRLGGLFGWDLGTWVNPWGSECWTWRVRVIRLRWENDSIAS